jgi:hypothetical protein
MWLGLWIYADNLFCGSHLRQDKRRTRHSGAAAGEQINDD